MFFDDTAGSEKKIKLYSRMLFLLWRKLDSSFHFVSFGMTLISGQKPNDVI